MIPLTLAEIAAVVGGAVEPATAADVTVTAPAFIDSRTPIAGGLFAAFPGEFVDGHEYAAAAVAGGAAAVIGTRPTPAPTVVVADLLEALARLARRVLSELPEVVRIGVTGSQGKTSTKDMLLDVLAAVAPTIASAESQNNEIGVPLTALRVDPSTRYLVAEMGARGPGHIKALCDIVHPVAAVVLNVGVAHIGEFGSREGIARGKGELVEALPADGVAVLNADDARVAPMTSRTDARICWFGRTADPASGVRLVRSGVSTDGRTALALAWGDRTRELMLGYLGEHQAMNAAAVVATAIGLGLDGDAAIEALAGARPRSHWRMEVTETPAGVVVLNDAYNANPDSMRAALATLASIARSRPGARTVAVLGEMLELGATSAAEHAALGVLVASHGVDRLITVGVAAEATHESAAAAGGWAGRSTPVADAAQALALLQGELRPGDIVLVKASRAAGLESLARELAAMAPADEGSGGR